LLVRVLIRCSQEKGEINMVRVFLVLLIIAALDSCSGEKLSSSLKAIHTIENQTFIIDMWVEVQDNIRF